MRYRFILFLTFMLAITLVLTACDGDEDESAEEVDATESSESDGEESSGSEDDSNSELQVIVKVTKYLCCTWRRFRKLRLRKHNRWGILSCDEASL